MAAVHGPIPAAHPSPFRSTHNASHPRMASYPQPSASTKPPSTQPTSRQDPFYGHEQASKLCARFITHLFACPEYPPPSSGSTVKLPQFIAYALHRTKLHASVTFAALVLLQRLKARFPTARGSSGHRLFVSAFMLASKVICDDTYSNKSWSIVAQGMFQLREINQMEREMCQYLEWELNVDPVTLHEFEEMIRKDFVGPGPYPTYILPSTKKTTPPPTANPFASSSTGPSPSPSCGQRYPSPPKPVYQPPPNPSSAYMTPPTTPDTPSPSYSTSTSPASSASPPTPPGVEDHTARIVSASSSPGLVKAEPMPIVPHSKSKMFAFASPAVW
ncbi:hypothetical protein PAXINDRAFT_77274 [Paxillus involutus ATCC 200175]|jgi:hypothetical protein|uniref:Cyclin-like domain-containing protein n=1 Tax=Paxillus involutus ATCC 200175 TaxID=664439 RepID=A0A0C9SZE2_PAXIN|nr:hypothetical protein PAXINDRAFT_77274 [Paxillus involutus ATCC 200175]